MQKKLSSNENSKEYSKPEFLNLRELVDSDPKKFDFVLPGLRIGNAGIFASPGGVGKSFWILQTAVQVSSGVEFMGFSTKSGNVVYISIEDDKDALHTRFKAIVEKFLPNTPDRERCYKNLFIHCPDPGSIDLMNNPEWLDSVCKGARLVIIDTMRLAHSGDENDPVQMSKFVASIILRARRENVAITLLAHSTKSSALNGQVELAQSLRGSSVLTDNMRFQSYIVGMSEDEARNSTSDISGDENCDQYPKYVRYGISKTNYGARGLPIWYFRGEHGILEHCEVVTKKSIKSKGRNNGGK